MSNAAKNFDIHATSLNKKHQFNLIFIFFSSTLRKR